MIYHCSGCVDVHWPRKNSELDNDNAGIVDDDQADDTTDVADVIKTSTMTAKETGHETLRMQLQLLPSSAPAQTPSLVGGWVGYILN